jgi:hypothetical protein
MIPVCDMLTLYYYCEKEQEALHKTNSVNCSASGKETRLREECILSQRNQSHSHYHGPMRGSKRTLELLESVVALEVTHRLRLILKYATPYKSHQAYDSRRS